MGKTVNRPSKILPALIVAAVMTVAVTLAVERHAVSADTASALAPASGTHNPALVTQGAWLAALGNCATCHTADQGSAYAGGRPLATPFGTVYATNITPDPETGIGKWSRSDFLRAMHQGVDRAGHDLFPAFPYDHFTHVADDDVDAIYAYLMSRDPVRAPNPANRMLVPRLAIAAWKALYLKPGVPAPDPTHDASWNRGRYLVDGLGHCGACHTPRNALGAEKEQQDLDGGTAEGWRAPALNAGSPAPLRWTVEQLVTYLRSGFDAAHGVAAGAMEPVAHNLSSVPEPELTAIAVYIAARMGAGTRATGAGNATGVAGSGGDESSSAGEGAPVDPRLGNDGEAIYRTTCAGCHDGGRRGIALDRSTSMTDAAPTNLIRITLEGFSPREGEKGGTMPAFRGALDDSQLSSLVAFVRDRFGHAPPWQDIGAEIGKARRADESWKPT